MDQWNLITLGMTSVSLVVAVVQLALISISTKAEEMYRQFVGKMACCHFSLVSFGIICVQSLTIIVYHHSSYPMYIAVTTITAAYGWHVILLDKNS